MPTRAGSNGSGCASRPVCRADPDRVQVETPVSGCCRGAGRFGTGTVWSVVGDAGWPECRALVGVAGGNSKTGRGARLAVRAWLFRRHAELAGRTVFCRCCTPRMDGPFCAVWHGRWSGVVLGIGCGAGVLGCGGEMALGRFGDCAQRGRTCTRLCLYRVSLGGPGLRGSTRHWPSLPVLPGFTG